MRLCGTFAGRSGVSLKSCLTLWLSIGMVGVVGAAEGQTPRGDNQSQAEPIEEIEVRGQGSLISLRKDIVNAETQVYNLFNQFNDVREFNITCEEAMVTGSRIAERECVPVYMQRARRTNVSNFLFSDLTPPSVSGTGPGTGAKSLNARGVQETEQELWFHNQPKHREMNAKFLELSSQHPELAAAAQDLQTKRERLAELEASQREESALGRFFARIGGKGEE